MKVITIEAEELTLSIICSDLDAKLALTEAQHRGTPIGGPYSIQFHKAHVRPNKDHIEVYKRNNYLYAFNTDFISHDGSRGIRIHNRVAATIKQLYPDIVIPDDNIIRECTADEMVELLLENEQLRLKDLL